MFDIESKVNKFGQKAFETDFFYGYYRNNLKGMSFQMTIPRYKTNIQLWTRDYIAAGVDRDSDPEIIKKIISSISVGNKKLELNYDDGLIIKNDSNIKLPIEQMAKDGFVNINYQAIVRLAVAYAWGQKNLKNTLLQGRTKKELAKLSVEELEKLNNTIDNFENKFTEAFRNVMLKQDVEDAQEIINEFFGKKAVNLDMLVEDAVDDALKYREEVTEKENLEQERIAEQERIKLEKQNLRDARIAKIKAGMVKTLEPVKMMAKKLENLADKIKLSVKNMKIAKERKQYKEKLLDNLDELSKQ